MTLVTSAALAAWLAGAAPAPPAIPPADRIRIAEAFHLAEEVGDRIWQGWRRVPFAICLVTPGQEFLIRHPRPPSSFTKVGEDPLLGGAVHARPRSFSTGMLATLRMEGVATIVAGQAESTQAGRSTPWVLTLLHEHLHQLQDADERYLSGVAGLELARGDDSGMWILDFPFHYEAAAVRSAFTVLARALSDAVGARGTPDFSPRLARFRAARGEFVAALTPEDRRYFGFQLWQEGVAQYTQLEVARRAALRHTPLPEFAALPDATSYAEEARALEEDLIEELPNLPLADYRRVAFYFIGSAEALLLDEARPGWKRRYFREMFALERLYPPR